MRRIGDHIPRVLRFRAGRRLGGIEEREQGAVRAQNPGELLRQPVSAQDLARGDWLFQIPDTVTMKLELQGYR